MNWIPFQAQITKDGRTEPAAQLNGDGSLWVDWEKIELMAKESPLLPLYRTEIIHLMLAMRNGNFADAPRDCPMPEPATETK